MYVCVLAARASGGGGGAGDASFNGERNSIPPVDQITQPSATIQGKLIYQTQWKINCMHAVKQDFSIYVKRRYFYLATCQLIAFLLSSQIRWKK
jgi:hypothetical protein